MAWARWTRSDADGLSTRGEAAPPIRRTPGARSQPARAARTRGATSSASPTSSPLAITISGSDGASASRSHHASKSGRSRFAATIRRAHHRVAAQVVPAHLRSATPLTPRVVHRRLDARRVVVERHHRIPPEPRGRDREHPRPAAEVEEPAARRQLEHQLEAQARGRMRAGPECLPRIDHDLNWSPDRRLPRRPHRQPAIEHERLVELAPPLRPVVGDLGSADLDERLRRQAAVRSGSAGNSPGAP